MAQSPTGRAPGESMDAYLNAWSTVGKLLLSGRSWSGNERNCCFLNTGDSKFADISAASGLDFINDGRAVAVVDWDYDGDLDFWLSNRDAPRVRFVRNDIPKNHHFLAIKLRGTKCNRNAIGARVELRFANSQPALIVKSLRAGEGFLSQSSKWLHFGLGARNRIERVVVRWPGGDVEEFSDLAVDRWYEIVQGGKPQSWTPPISKSRLEPSELTLPRSTERTRLVILDRMQIPKMSYETFDGKMTSFEKYRGKPLLINIWASWCAPCLAELSDFRENAETLQASGLNILALSVDGMVNDTQRDASAVKDAFERLNVPFDGGVAPRPLVSLLERGPGLFLNKNASLPIPSSFLFDEQGRIAIIYTGPVKAAQLQADLALLNASRRELLAATTPFPGHWLDESPTESADQPVAQDENRSIFVYGGLGGLLVLGLCSILYVRARSRRARETGNTIPS